MPELQELVLPVPDDLVKNFSGLSIDIGGSLVKFAYRSKTDSQPKGRQTGTASVGRIQLLSCPKCLWKEAAEMVRVRADIRRTDNEPTTICATGMGCMEYSRRIGEMFDVTVKVGSEVDIVPRTFFHLASRMSRTHLLEPYERSAVEDPIAEVRGIMTAVKMSNAMTGSKTLNVNVELFEKGARLAQERPRSVERADLPLVQAEPDTFPCLLVMCGSAYLFFSIDERGKYKLPDASLQGGASHLGIGTLLTGCKNYTELVEAAARGERRKIDVYSDMMSDQSADPQGQHLNGNANSDFYSTMSSIASFPLYLFGHAIGKDKDSLKREDIARAWLHYTASELASRTQSVCEKLGIRRVFFCGGLCNERLVRQVITSEFLRRTLSLMYQEQGDYIEFDFITAGAHLGTLGCVISDVDNFM